MGIHAFGHEPEHCEVYRAHVGPNMPPIYGLEEGWNMPVARHRRALGHGMFFRGVDHYVLTYHIAGAPARRLEATPLPTARQGALSLQRPQSAGKFSSTGVVEYGHFYFKQSLLCEVAEEAGLAHFAEPEDFFAITDQAAARDAEAYLHRAMDAADPPTSIEMDGRSYLIALGILRATQKRAELRGLDAAEVARADLRRVLAAIEDRLSEPLRLSDLSELLGMSPFHFARVFKEHVGEPPAQYLQRRRAERAVEMIRSSDLALSEIAFRTGFSSQSHMTRHVKAAAGTTPGKLRSGR